MGHPGRSAIKDQAEQLTDLRSRAGTLLAAASIAGTFAGATHGSIDTMAALALIAYLCTLGACIYVLLPHELAIEFRGTVLLTARAETGASDEEAFEAVVQWPEQVRAGNSGRLRKLKNWYTAAAGALGAEVVLWILTLATYTEGDHMANETPKPNPRPNPMPASPPPGFAIPETRSGDQAIITEQTWLGRPRGRIKVHP